MGETVAVQKNTDGWKPIPDPTVLTTELTLREVANLKELMEAKIGAAESAIDRIRERLDTRHAEIREGMQTLQAFFDEKFESISIQFEERDKRQDQGSSSDRLAIAAALQAQKESMGKTEASFTKQLDALQMVMNNIAKASDEKIDDLKTRVTMFEGKTKGIGESWGIIVAAGGLATGILIAVASYIR